MAFCPACPRCLSVSVLPKRRRALVWAPIVTKEAGLNPDVAAQGAEPSRQAKAIAGKAQSGTTVWSLHHENKPAPCRLRACDAHPDPAPRAQSRPTPSNLHQEAGRVADPTLHKDMSILRNPAAPVRYGSRSATAHTCRRAAGADRKNGGLSDRSEAGSPLPFA